MFTYQRSPSDNASQMFSSNCICYLLVPIHNILLSRPSKADSPLLQYVHLRSVLHPAASGQHLHPHRSMLLPNCDCKISYHTVSSKHTCNRWAAFLGKVEAFK